ncbi:MAG: hypothetical protein OXE96_16260 [Gemmatimonadetes bacterium]|nr:hypothetical protein [Gemmatimonadota bacterium]
MGKTKKARRQKRREADRGRWHQAAFRAVWSLEDRRRPEGPRMELPRVLEDRADGGMERLATFRAGGGS